MYLFFLELPEFTPYIWIPHTGHPPIYPLIQVPPTARPCCGLKGSCNPEAHEQSEFTRYPLFCQLQILELVLNSPSQTQALNTPAHFPS